MKEMTLHDVQAVSLDIMKHLHAFCVNNNIKYSLGYGSAIGAIRHKGFIPWDDDIDVVMTREDFDHFCQVWNDTSDYKLFSFSRRNMYAACARLCEMKRTLVKTGSPLFTEPTGLWIDIFPLDSVDEERRIFDSKISKIREIQDKVFWCREDSRMITFKEFLHPRVFVRWLKNVRQSRRLLFSVVAEQDEYCRNFADQNSKMMSLLVFPAYIKKDYSPKYLFDEVIDTPFEDASFKIMKGYNEWLTIIYGDYMTPPSDQNSKRGHTVHKYYWK